LSDISQAKKRLRREAGDRRLARHAADDGSAAVAAVGHFMTVVETAAPEVVSAYWSVQDELATQPLLQRLHDASISLCLPVVARPASPLVFRRWRPGDPMVSGVHNIPVPGDGAPEAVPSVLVVPLLAYDGAGYRLGYGGGYYDRTLAALRDKGNNVLAIGYAYEAQKVEAVPHDHLDQPLDWVVTEQGAWKVER
jgi:5-formyltetrahydrofolate cyclo-ligase